MWFFPHLAQGGTPCSYSLPSSCFLLLLNYFPSSCLAWVDWELPWKFCCPPLSLLSFWISTYFAPYCSLRISSLRQALATTSANVLGCWYATQSLRAKRKPHTNLLVFASLGAHNPGANRSSWMNFCSYSWIALVPYIKFTNSLA